MSCAEEPPLVERLDAVRHGEPAPKSANGFRNARWEPRAAAQAEVCRYTPSSGVWNSRRQSKSDSIKRPPPTNTPTTTPPARLDAPAGPPPGTAAASKRSLVPARRTDQILDRQTRLDVRQAAGCADSDNSLPRTGRGRAARWRSATTTDHAVGDVARSASRRGLRRSVPIAARRRAARSARGLGETNCDTSKGRREEDAVGEVAFDRNLGQAALRANLFDRETRSYKE